MALFGDILGGLFGQQKVPSFQTVSPEDLIKRSMGQLPAIAAGQMEQAQGGARAQRAAENIFDPNQGALREATTSRILADLNLGGAIPAEIQRSVTQSALGSGIASGLGLSPAGRSVVARDLGLTGLDLINDRLQRAMGYTRSAPVLNEIYNPASIGIGPSDVANQIVANQNAQNQFNTFSSGIKSQNLMNAVQTPFRLAGSVLGGAIGGPAFGIGAGAAGGGGLNFSSILSGLFRPSSVPALPA